MRALAAVLALFVLAGCDPARDTDPPQFVFGPEVVARDTSITVAFVTNEPANAIIEYGPDTNYGTSVLDERYVEDHAILVTNLADSTTYQLRVITQDALDNGRASANFQVTTDAFTPPPLVVVNEVLANAADESSGEFVELLNNDPNPVNVAGWTIADNADSDILVPFTLLGGTTTTIPAGEFAISYSYKK